MTKLAKGILIAAVALVILAGLIVGVVVGVGLYGARQMKRAANERAAAQNLDIISVAQIRYYTENANYASFDQLIGEGFLDSRFAGDSPIVDGYVYVLKVKPESAGQKASFIVNANPVSDATGKRHFFIDDRSSTVRVNPDQPARGKDPQYVR